MNTYSCVLTMLIFLLVFVTLIFVVSRRRFTLEWGNIEDSKIIFWIYLCAFIFLTVLLYSDFLFGNKLFIFYYDIGSDSMLQTYPKYVNLASYIERGIFWDYWNSNNSLGNVGENILPTLNYWVCFWGVKNVAKLLAVSQVIKILLAGFFFYAFLRTMGQSRLGASVFSVLYAYNAQIIVRSAWQAYPNEVALFAIWLWAFEMYYKKDKWVYLPIVTAFFFLNFSGYYLVLYTGIFFAYTFFRFLSENDFKKLTCSIKKMLKMLVSIIIGILVSGITSFKSLSSMLESDRFQESSSTINWNIITPKEESTVFFRTLGQDILGVSTDYSGVHNFLDGPAFYCGMLTIILIPYAFYRFDNKKRIFYALGYIVAILYILVIPLRYFVNGKASVTYKLASLWIIALMLITAAQAFDELLRKRKKDSLIIMPIVAAVILLMTKKLYIDGIVSNRLYASLIVMVIYIVLIGLGVIIKKNYIICMVLPLVLLEVCWASYNVINNRGVLDKSQLEDKVWYNDYSNEAIEYIEENVQSNYRVDKEYMSTFLCDSLYQEYNGTMAYVGGAAGNNNTNEFYYTLGFPTYSTNHYMFGFAQSTAINTLLNVGYTLTNNDEVSQYGYEKEMTTGNVNVFRNMNALPLGMTYSKYILKEDFEKCTIAQKRNIIMKACVVDSVEDAVGLEPLEYEDMQDTLYYVPDIERYKQEITPTTDNGRLNIITDPLDDENVLVLKMKMNNNDSTLYVGSGATAFGSSILFYANSQEYKIYSSFMKGEDEYIYEFSVPGTDTVSFEITDSMSLENLEVYIIPKEIYYQEYLSEVEGLSKADVSSETIETNLFEMEYNLQKSQLVYFSTPYDKGWHVYVDGVEQDLKQVNIAFMGTYVEEGEHIIELKYENHDKYYICTIIGALMYICLGIYQRKTKREKLLCEEE